MLEAERKNKQKQRCGDVQTLLFLLQETGCQQNQHGGNEENLHTRIESNSCGKRNHGDKPPSQSILFARGRYTGELPRKYQAEKS